MNITIYHTRADPPASSPSGEVTPNINHTQPSHLSHLHDIEAFLHLLDQEPLVLAYIVPEMRLERIDRRTRDVRVQCILFFYVATVDGLIGALDLDGDGGLAGFADGNLLVIALDGCTVARC
jgi:hypothetical protein